MNPQSTNIIQYVIGQDGRRYRVVLVPDDETTAKTTAVQTFKPLIDQYLRHRQNFTNTSAATLREYRLELNRFNAWLIHGNIEVVCAETWLAYYVHRKSSNIGPYTLRNSRNYLKKFADWLLERGEITANPMQNIIPPQPPKNPPSRAIDKKHIQPMFDHAKTDRDHALLLFFRTSGCRIAEAQQLTWADIDLNNGIARIIGKGNKHRPLLFTPDTATAIDEYRRGLKQSEPWQNVWQGLRGDLKKNGIYQIFKRTAKRAGIYDIALWNPHAWRHRWARDLSRAGMDINYLKYLLGHESLKTTEIYTAPEPQEVKQVYNQYAHRLKI